MHFPPSLAAEQTCPLTVQDDEYMSTASECRASEAVKECSSLHTDSTTVGDQPLDPEIEFYLPGAMTPTVETGQVYDPSALVVDTSHVPPSKFDPVDPTLSSDICVSKRTSIISSRSVGSHSSYAWSEGEEQRTLLRGWLHGVLSISVFPAAIISVILAVALEFLPPRWIMMGVLLVGKLMSYAASAVLHLFPFQRSKTAKRALRVDIMMIPVAIGAPVVPFSQQLDEALATVGVHAAFFALTAIVVVLRPPKFDSGRGVIVVGGGGRICLLLTQWIIAEMQVGLKVGFESPLWIASLLTYCFSFACMPCRGRPLRLPWHRPAVYGWHEEFHTLLFLGDLLTFALAAQFLLDPDSL